MRLFTNRTAVPKQTDKSRYMFSLSISLIPEHSARQDYTGRSLLSSYPGPKGKLTRTSLLPALDQATGYLRRGSLLSEAKLNNRLAQNPLLGSLPSG